MLTVLVVNIISVLLAFLAKYRNFKFGLEVSFLVITIFLALRYNYGNDYKPYLEMFKSINSVESLDLSLESDEIEPGWKLLNRFFMPFGFFWMVITITIFQCLVYYRFIKKYVPIKWQWFAVFIYTFSAGFMLTQLSMMRQALAMSIFLLAIDCIYQRKVVHYIISVFIASMFHQSALLMLPLILLGFVNIKLNRFWIIAVLSVFMSTIVFQSFFADQINLLVASNFEKYEYYMGTKTEINSGIGLAFQIVVLLVILIYENKQNKDSSLLFKLSIIGYVFIPLSFIVALIGRVGMYLNIMSIAVFPLVGESMKNKKVRYAYVILLILWTLYGFFGFFTSDVWKEAFGSYQTIFSSPYWQ